MILKSIQSIITEWILLRISKTDVIKTNIRWVQEEWRFLSENHRLEDCHCLVYVSNSKLRHTPAILVGFILKIIFIKGSWWLLIQLIHCYLSCWKFIFGRLYFTFRSLLLWVAHCTFIFCMLAWYVECTMYIILCIFISLFDEFVFLLLYKHDLVDVYLLFQFGFDYSYCDFVI